MISNGESAGIAQRYNRSETIYTYFLMFMNALSTNILGPIMPNILSDYAISKSDAALMLVFQSAGAIIAIFLGGILSRLVNKTHLVSGSLLLYCLCMMAIPFAPGYGGLLYIFFVLGAGNRILDMMLNAYISDLRTKNRSFFITLLHSVFGVGALMGPVYVMVAFRSGHSWKQIFWTLGVSFFAVLLGYLLYKSAVFRGHKELYASPEKQKKGEGSSVVYRDPFICLLGLIMLLYMGYQYSVITWSPSYMQEVFGVPSTQFGSPVTWFWVGITLSRLGFARLALRYNSLRLIGVSTALGTVSLICMVFAPSPVFMLICIFATGLFAGAVIPLLMAHACDLYPDYSGAIAPLLFLLAAIGTMMIPWLAGLVAETLGFQAGMLVNVTVLAVIVACCGLAKLPFFQQKNSEFKIL